MTPKNADRPLVPYLRQSRSKEKTISIEEQRRAIETWAKANGVALAPEVIEQNVSGNKPWQERGLGQAIANCGRPLHYLVEDEKTGTAVAHTIQPNGQPVQGVIVAYQDRLSRQNGKGTAEVWEALENAQARLVCAAEGLDTAKGDQELQFSIKAAIARDQWKRSKANWTSARRSAVERGVMPGKPPFGYRRPSKGAPLEPDPETAPYLVGIFERRASGAGWSEIADWLNAEGVKKPYSDTPWLHTNVSKLVRSETYLGVAWDEVTGERNETSHPPLVSTELWYAVNRAKADKPAKKVSKLDVPIGGGYVRCGACGVGLVRTTSNRGAMYTCRNPRCKETSISANALEPYVCEVIAEATVWKIEEPYVATEAVDAARTAVEEAQRAIEVFDETWVDQGLDQTAAISMRKALETRLEKARVALAEIPVETVDWRSQVRAYAKGWNEFFGKEVIDPDAAVAEVEVEFTSGLTGRAVFALLQDGGKVAREVVRHNLREVVVHGKSSTPGRPESRESVESRVDVRLVDPTPVDAAEGGA